MKAEYILAGDVGGTKTILALASAEQKEIPFLHKKWFESRRHDSLESMVKAFLMELNVDTARVAASFGVAGPVRSGRVKATNLPWLVEGSALQKTLGLHGVSLINDFKAIGFGIPSLNKEDLAVLNTGIRDEGGPMAIIGAGTGLGEGLICPLSDEKGFQVFPSEGGHSSFAPTSDEEIGLLQFMLKETDHVSFEKVLSGVGLANIYRYLSESGFAEKSPEVTKEMAGSDAPAVIASYGLSGKDRLCEKSLRMFVSIYGNEAGNLALKPLPSGGLYLAGGMAPKILARLEDGTIMKAFLNKGRLSEYLKSIPVSVILNEEVGLIGAAVNGRELA